MKLSEIVDYLNLLERDELSPDYLMAARKLESIKHVIQNHSFQIDSFGADFANKVEQVNQAFWNVQIHLEDLKTHLREMIKQQEPEYYQRSQRIYEEESKWDTNEHILHRRLTFDEKSNELLRGQLLQYTDWRVAGMLIRPGLESFVEELVPLDPLYLVDQNLELLQPAVDGFTNDYQHRLRQYTINDYERKDKPVLWQLPNNQFGFIFCYNYFNYKPIDVIKHYLDEFYLKLRLGGVAIFTFNDCDYAHGVALAERSFMCYTPSRIIRTHALSLGFEILHSYQGEGNVAWLQLKKPGEIESIRGGQSLAKIIAN